MNSLEVVNRRITEMVRAQRRRMLDEWLIDFHRRARLLLQES